MDLVDYGVIVDGGNTVYLNGMVKYMVEKITDEEFEAMEQDYDDIEAPPGPYVLQPENQGRTFKSVSNHLWKFILGKILWLSGSPGMGKSTSAQILGREHGYVYYEADSFGILKNPFNDLNIEDPSLGQMKQKSLKGKGSSERAAFMKKQAEVWAPLMAGEEYDQEAVKRFYRMMCEDILKQKQRIGGNWAIAHVVFSRIVRDTMREILGPDLTFIHLTMDKEDKLKRLQKRHDGNEQFIAMMEVERLTFFLAFIDYFSILKPSWTSMMKRRSQT